MSATNESLHDLNIDILTVDCLVGSLSIRYGGVPPKVMETTPFGGSVCACLLGFRNDADSCARTSDDSKSLTDVE